MHVVAPFWPKHFPLALGVWYKPSLVKDIFLQLWYKIQLLQH